MTRKEFLFEIHEYVEQQYKELLDNQDRIKDIFSIFHRICIENNIKYFVAFGSLLAQVRDDGFIPWDSDFDVCISINDVSQLQKCLKENLPKDYYMESNFINKKYPYFQMRIGKKGYDSNLLHLDIFYVIGAPNVEKIPYFQKKVIKLFNDRMNKAYCEKLRKDRKTKKEKVLWIYYLLKTSFISYELLNRRFEKLIHMYSYDNAKNVTVVCHENISFEKKLIEPIHLKKYHDLEMLVPSDEDAFLNRLYKNYKEYLPIQRRFDEFYSWVKQNDPLVNKKIEYRK